MKFYLEIQLGVEICIRLEKIELWTGEKNRCNFASWLLAWRSRDVLKISTEILCLLGIRWCSIGGAAGHLAPEWLSYLALTRYPFWDVLSIIFIYNSIINKDVNQNCRIIGKKNAINTKVNKWNSFIEIYFFKHHKLSARRNMNKKVDIFLLHYIRPVLESYYSFRSIQL